MVKNKVDTCKYTYSKLCCRKSREILNEPLLSVIWKTVINMGTKLYNKLPGYIKEIDSYKTFRKELK